MSYMSALATAGITVEEMSAYLKDHPGVDFDEAVKEIQNRHTEEHTANVTRKIWKPIYNIPYRHPGETGRKRACHV